MLTAAEIEEWNDEIEITGWEHLVAMQEHQAAAARNEQPRMGRGAQEWAHMENLQHKAERFADRLTGARTPLTWGDLRDLLDLWTGEELDCIPLDILTDLTARKAAERGVKVRWEFGECGCG